MTQPFTQSLTLEDMQAEICRLQDFKDEWEPVLVQMVPALVAIVNLANSMLPPGMREMMPPQVRAFVEATL